MKPLLFARQDRTIGAFPHLENLWYSGYDYSNPDSLELWAKTKVNNSALMHLIRYSGHTFHIIQATAYAYRFAV